MVSCDQTMPKEVADAFNVDCNLAACNVTAVAADASSLDACLAAKPVCDCRDAFEVLEKHTTSCMKDVPDHLTAAFNSCTGPVCASWQRIAAGCWRAVIRGIVVHCVCVCTVCWCGCCRQPCDRRVRQQRSVAVRPIGCCVQLR